MAPTTSRYLTLANTLLVIATFAGTLTFSTLLTVPDLSDTDKNLLGFASALFLGSVTGVFPIILTLQGVKDDQELRNVSAFCYIIVVVGYVILTAFISTAFLLLMVVLKHHTSQAAFILGTVLLATSTTLSGFVAGSNFLSYG